MTTQTSTSQTSSAQLRLVEQPAPASSQPEPDKKNKNKIDWDAKKTEILSRIEVRSEMESFGIRFANVSPSTAGWIPVHNPYNSDKHPSAGVNIGSDSHRGYLVTFNQGNCERTATNFWDLAKDFHPKLRGSEFKEIIVHYAQQTGVDLRLQTKKPPTKEKVDFYKTSITHEVRTFLLNHRGLTDASLEKYEIGWAPKRERLSFPVYDAQGGLVNIRYHAWRKEQKPKTLNTSGFGEKRLWGVDRLRAAPEGTICCVTIGEWDAMLIEQETGLLAVSPTNGDEAFDAAWTKEFYGKHVVLVCDCDTSCRQAVDSKIIPAFRPPVRNGNILSFKIVWLFDDPKNKQLKDFTDFIIKAGGSGADLIKLIDAAEVRDFPMPTTDLPEPIILSTFKEIDNPDYVGRRVSLPLYIHGENSESYHAPIRVFVGDCVGKKKNGCHGRDDWKFSCDEAVPVKLGDRIQLCCVGSSDFQMKGYLREFVCDKGQKPVIHIDNEDRLTIREIYAHQVLSGSSETETVEKAVYTIGGKIYSIGQYQATGFIHSNPRNQKPTMLIDTMAAQEEDWQAFDIDRERLLLRRLQAISLDELMDDLMFHVTHIYDRPDLHLGVMLTLCSPKWIDFPGEGKIRGWISSVVIGDTGCHAKGTEILMADGKIKKVEAIEAGECLLGPDSQPKKIKRLYRGTEQMYRIVPVKGKPFIVNESHILSLKTTPRVNGVEKKFVNISVREYLQKSARFKHLHKLYRSGIIEFDRVEEPLAVDPYFLGVYLGDGHELYRGQCVTVTTMDQEVVDELRAQAILHGLKVEVSYALMANAYRVVNKKTGNHPNPLKEKFFSLGIDFKCHKKSVPLNYKTGSIQTRLSVLAGLLDTDGNLCGANTYEFTSKSQQLTEDTAFIARSLGLSANIRKKIVNETPYYRVHISGETNIIPCRVAHKKAQPRKQIKDVLVTGFSVEPVGVDEFFGFELGGDHLYLMGDFTVTHNTGKSTVSEEIFNYAGVGYRVSGMTSSRTGITYACEYDEKRGWRIKAGALLKMSGQAMIIDEAQDLPEEDLKTMAEALDRGRLKIDRIQNKEFEAETRCFFSCNPVSEKRSADQRTMGSYKYGCRAVGDIFPKMMLRRLDMVMFAASFDIKDKSSVFNKKKPDDFVQTVSPENIRALIYYAWNLPADHIVIPEDVGLLIREQASLLSAKFGGGEDLPIVYPEDFRKTFCRMCVACATADLSSDDDFETIVVRPYHVEYMTRALDKMYSAKNCQLNKHALEYEQEHSLDDEWKVAERLRNHMYLNYGRANRMAIIFGELLRLDPENKKEKLSQIYLHDVLDVDRRTVFSDMKPLLDERLVVSSRGYLPTSKLFQLWHYLNSLKDGHPHFKLIDIEKVEMD